MAKNALLIWCAGSAIVCGSAALATTSLWRGAEGIASAAPADVTPAPVAAAMEPAVVTAPSQALAPREFVSVETLSFFSPRAAGASNFFRGTLDESAPAIPSSDSAAATLQTPLQHSVPETASAEPAPASPAEAFSQPEASSSAFAEVKPDGNETDHRLSVLPPPRPSFQLARLEANAKAAVTPTPEGQGGLSFTPPAPVPQTSPGWNWDEVLAPPVKPGRSAGPERVINAGIASWYGPGFHGRKTANGERFDQMAMTAAHRTLPFGTLVKVVDEKTGRSVVVRINDRGPFAHGRVIDLSKGAAQALGVNGLARVRVVAAAN